MASNDTGHPDEVVTPEHETNSDLMAEAAARHAFAETEYATPQEKKQAAVEQAHALSTRPNGSYAQLHETDEPTLAVADPKRVEELKAEQDKAIAKLEGKDDASDPDSSAGPAPDVKSPASTPAKATPAPAKK